MVFGGFEVVGLCFPSGESNRDSLCLSATRRVILFRDAGPGIVVTCKLNERQKGSEGKITDAARTSEIGT